MSRRSENSTKVFVGSLPNGVTAEDLRGLFAPYGEISECDIANRCGFLHLEDQELAIKAITELNGSNFMGGRISVEKGRVKPRRSAGGGAGGPMRGGKDRAGPYQRNDFPPRGPPARNGGYGGGGRDFPPYGGGGDRFGGFERPPARGGYDGGYGERRPPFEDRRGGYGGERRPYNSDFERRPYGGSGFDAPRPEYDDRRVDFEERRPLLSERRPLLDQRGAAGFDRAPELYSRRDQGPKPMGASGSGFAGERAAYGSNGYNGGYSTGGSGAGSYGTSAGPPGGYSTGTGGFGSGGSQGGGGYSEVRGGYGGGSGGGYGGQGGGYGDSYGSGAGGGGRSGNYDSAYPPLPQQRPGFASGGGPGPRRDMAPGRRF